MIERSTWRQAAARAWLSDAIPPTTRLLRVESRKGDVVSSGKFTGASIYPNDHWRCVTAAPAVRWMRGLRWEDARAHLGRRGFSWQWL